MFFYSLAFVSLSLSIMPASSRLWRDKLRPDHKRWNSKSNISFALSTDGKQTTMLRWKYVQFLTTILTIFQMYNPMSIFYLCHDEDFTLSINPDIVCLIMMVDDGSSSSLKRQSFESHIYRSRRTVYSEPYI